MTTIYHNPRCSKSRQTLQLLEEQGIKPEIILYLKHTPSADTLRALLATLNISARELIRSGEDAYKKNNVADQNLSEDQLIATMVKHPTLIQRPIVVNGDKAAIGRPPEAVLGIL